MEWISVDERLPDREDKYLVQTISGEIQIHWFETEFNDGFGIDARFITHWMPLPEPAQEVV